MGSRKKSSVVRYLLGYFYIALFTVSPLLCVGLASLLAAMFGVENLNEGSAPQADIFGTNIVGQTIYSLLVMGWLFILTIPVGSIGFICFTVVMILELCGVDMKNKPNNVVESNLES